MENIVDENGNIVNKNPLKEDLKGLVKFPHYKINRKKLFTEQEIIEKLQKWAKVHGRTPTYEDFLYETPHGNTIIGYFRSWNNAIKKARLNINNHQKNKK